MSYDDFKGPVLSSKVKDFYLKSNRAGHYYCIFRIGKSYKSANGSMLNTLKSIRGFQKHMEREIEVPNANIEIKNEILVGNKDIYGTVKEYIKDIKLRKDGVMGKELLLTASPDFFKGIMTKDLELWKQANIDYLLKTFGSNLVYLTCHNDEKSVHLHALIIPKFYNEKTKKYVLANKRYFGGAQRLREFQDNYSATMQEHFNCLKRGVKYSQAKHITMKEYYSLINQNLNEKDIKSLTAKAKNSELLEIKIKAIEKTLQVYKKYNSKNELEKDAAIKESKSLVKDIEKMKDDKEMYKEALSMISQQYEVPQYVLTSAIKMCENINNKEQERE